MPVCMSSGCSPQPTTHSDQPLSSVPCQELEYVSEEVKKMLVGMVGEACGEDRILAGNIISKVMAN